MASLTIRQLDEDIKSKLRMQAARHGHSMEAEARAVLARAFADEEDSDKGIATRIQEIVSKAGGFDLPIPDRGAKPSQRHLDFSDESYG